jgi:hypothetical protein
MRWYAATLGPARSVDTPHRPPTRYPRSDGTTVEGSPDMATGTRAHPGEGP